MTDTKCNGWTNYETWQAALWLNEEDFLGRCQENEVREIDSEMLDAELYYIAEADAMVGLARDIYNSWISCVNLNEIADTFNQDLTAMGEQQ